MKCDEQTKVLTRSSMIDSACELSANVFLGPASAHVVCDGFGSVTHEVSHRDCTCSFFLAGDGPETTNTRLKSSERCRRERPRWIVGGVGLKVAATVMIRGHDLSSVRCCW